MEKEIQLSLERICKYMASVSRKHKSTHNKSIDPAYSPTTQTSIQTIHLYLLEQLKIMKVVKTIPHWERKYEIITAYHPIQFGCIKNIQPHLKYYDRVSSTDPHLNSTQLPSHSKYVLLQYSHSLQNGLELIEGDIFLSDEWVHLSKKNKIHLLIRGYFEIWDHLLNLNKKNIYPLVLPKVVYHIKREEFMLSLIDCPMILCSEREKRENRVDLQCYSWLKEKTEDRAEEVITLDTHTKELIHSYYLKWLDNMIQRYSLRKTILNDLHEFLVGDAKGVSREMMEQRIHHYSTDQWRDLFCKMENIPP